eukprot:TRINITY_DN121624_c0_g1_i1.p1 TRINITY_DN121624_c0_g1~~TRINITY_DN121624_c0_g1_i1.p1  ORF type:complete len:270 (-),score=6.09 TRINITY_DN121624_c0_g1_i1:204-1013(-)
MHVSATVGSDHLKCIYVCCPSPMDLSALDDEINVWWCLGDTWMCTPTDAMGLHLVLGFVFLLVAATAIHQGVQAEKATDAVDDDATRRHTRGRDAFCPVTPLPLALYLAALVSGAMVWLWKGTQWVHPMHDGSVQLAGCCMLVCCYIGFIGVHVSMGQSWSAQPEVKTQHELVKRGLFRCARHPMYAVFLWYAIAAGVATLNWMIALLAFFPFFAVMHRIPIEEEILTDLYGAQYREYQSKVSALGPPWCCCTCRSLSNDDDGYQTLAV